MQMWKDWQNVWAKIIIQNNKRMEKFQQIVDTYSRKYGKIVIDLGCGSGTKPENIGLDVLPLSGVDYIADLEAGLSFIKDNTVDEYITSHFLEHVQNFELLMSEIYRTLKPGGVIRIIVPHFSNPYYYSDYTHKRFFGLYTFDYFSDGKNALRRRTPVYNSSFSFAILSRKLVFKSPNFQFLNLIKKHFWTRLFNSGKFIQALYEESFTNFLSCYELNYTLRANK